MITTALALLSPDLNGFPGNVSGRRLGAWVVLARVQWSWMAAVPEGLTASSDLS